MTKRMDFDAGAQGDVLRRYRVRTRKGRTRVAVELGMEADTYRRYETGQTEMRISQVIPFARVFGIPSRELADALGLLSYEPQADSWTLRDALHGQIPVALIDELAREWEGREIADQKAAVEGILKMADQQRQEATRLRDADNLAG